MTIKNFTHFIEKNIGVLNENNVSVSNNNHKKNTQILIYFFYKIILIIEILYHNKTLKI